MNLPYEISAVSSYTTLNLTTEDRAADEFPTVKIVADGIPIKVSGYTVAAEVFDAYEGFDYGKNECTKHFDYDKIKDVLLFRKRETGDLISVTSSGGSKKLKDFMIDVKIPADLRDSVPILASGSDVLWVVGYRMSESYKVTDKTKRILKVTVLKED